MTHYLVKWCSLPYEESTWELQEDVDPVKIREFEELKKIPELTPVVRSCIEFMSISMRPTFIFSVHLLQFYFSPEGNALHVLQ